jgi:chromosome segregation ATPase
MKGTTMSITRSLIRWGLIGGVALGAVTLLVGPERVSASLSVLRSKAQGIVDKCVDDPVALRRQLQDLAKQYPDRIAKVRGELAAVEHQMSVFTEDIDKSTRVVAATTQDLGQLKVLVSRAEESAKQTARPVAIRFEGVKFNIDEAYNEARRINNVRMTYQDRLASDKQQLAFLTQQRDRLMEILNKLESEHNTFQAQLWQLDRQIDAIERNERLIDFTEQQQATLASYEKFGKVGNLKQIEGKLAELRAIQEAQLDALSKKGLNMDYERKAEYQMSTEQLGKNPFDEIGPPAEPSGNGEVKDEQPAGKNSRTLAFAEPIVIE